jgi:hypothetical protein
MSSVVSAVTSQLSMTRIRPFRKVFGALQTIKKPKGGRSANKFRKSQIRKFAELNYFLDLRTFRECDSLRICDL